MIKKFFDDIATSFGSSTREFLELPGSMMRFFWRNLTCFPKLIFRRNLVVEQMVLIGLSSMPIIWLSATFTGFIVTYQIQYMMADMMPLSLLGTMVGKVVFTDLGPVLTALVLTGRISAKIASELGTMRITDQIDAMICLSLEPFEYLLAPRLLAGFLMTPILFIFAFFFSIFSAQMLATVALNLPAATFYNGMRMLFRVQDVALGVFKGFTFGGLVTLAGCYYGYYTRGGAVGVGTSTMKAVVTAAVLVLLFNLIINQVFM